MYYVYENKSKKRFILEERENGNRRQLGSFKTRKEAELNKGFLETKLEDFEAPFIEQDEPRVTKYLKSLKGLFKKRASK